MVRLIHAPLALALVAGACKTADVTQTEPTAELYELSDLAFGEYLAFLDIPGIGTTEEDGAIVYTIDVNRVDGVAELRLSKTSSSVQALTKAGVATAEDKIVDVDGIQHFVNLLILRLTANDVEELDLTALADLHTLQMNFNLAGELDLTQNSALEELRYQGSAQADEGQKLESIDLSGNPNLRHLFLPNHDLVTIDLSNNPLIDEELDLSGNPGPDGDPNTPDIVVPAAIYDQVPEKLRRGVVSDADVGVLVSLVASSPSIDEAGGSTTLSANLNVAAVGNVTVTLGFDGTATEGDDFSVGATELTIPAGELSATTTLTALDDADEEGIELIEVMVQSVSGAKPGAISAVEISIDGDELDPGLVLNEILYDPSNGEADGKGNLPGDANGDGVYVQDDDEFVELVNVSGAPLDLSGFAIWDTEAWLDEVPRHVVPKPTVLADGEAIVIFGGGTPTGDFGNALVQTATSGRMNLNNAGDLFRLTDAEGLLVLQFDIAPLSNNPNESYTRVPDLTGAYEQHSDSTKVLFSPGTRIDGSPF